MSFDANERSTEESQPIDLYEFVAGATTYRYTSFPVDVVALTQTWTAVPISRSAVRIANHNDQPEIIVSLAVSTSLVQAVAAAIPPQTFTATIRRYQQQSAQAIIIWQGSVTGITFSGRDATLRIPSRLDDPFRTQIPSAKCQRTCNHVLYDARCTVVRASFKVDTIIASITGGGRIVSVSSMGGNPNDWAQAGDCVAGGERRLILSQVGTALLLLSAFPSSVVPGAAITVFAGCDHTVATCNAKFTNLANFGGHPRLHFKNPFASRFAWR